MSDQETVSKDLIRFTPISDMYKAAKELIALIDAGVSNHAPSEALEALRRSVQACDEAITNRDGYAESIKYAQDTMSNDECEIDDNPVVSDCPGDGLWVSSWQWCPWWTTIELKPTQVVWTSDADIRLYFQPIDSEEYEHDDVFARVAYFLGGKAEILYVVPPGDDGGFVYAKLTGIKVAELARLGVSTIDGRDH